MIILFMLFTSQMTYAFDPSSVLGALDSLGSALGMKGESSGEAINAFSELYTEINQDASISADGQRMVNEIQEIEALAREAGYTTQEMAEIDQGVSDAKSFDEHIRQVTRAVRAGKRALALIRKPEKKAQASQIEQTEIAKEELAQIYALVRQGQSESLRTVKEELRSQIDKKNQIKALRSELVKKGAKQFRSSGILSFPKSDRIVDESIKTAIRLKEPLLGLMLLVFLCRLVFYQFGFFGLKSVGDLGRDTILCAMLLVIFPDLVRAIISASMGIADSVISKSTVDIQLSKLVLPEMSNVLTSTKLFLLAVFEWIGAVSFFLIDFVMNFGIAFLVMLFPVAIFASQMMNFSIGWSMFLGTFVLLTLWPLMWNLVGVCAELVWKNGTGSFSDHLYGMLLTLMQVAGPFIGIKLLSGGGVADSITGGVGVVSKPITGTFKTLVSEKRELRQGYLDGSPYGEEKGKVGFLNRQGNPSLGRTVGSAAGKLFGKNLKPKAKQVFEKDTKGA